MTQLFGRDSGRAFDVQQRQSEVNQLKAQLESAKWNLDKTIVRAPGDNYVTNVALRKGARVANLPLAPVMAFIDTSPTPSSASRSRRTMPAMSGPARRSRSKFMPGQIHGGKVGSVLQAITTGQLQTSGTAATPKAIPAAPFVARVVLDDAEFAPHAAGGKHGGGRDLHRPAEGDSRRPESCCGVRLTPLSTDIPRITGDER
jgi:hypothetical protein